MEKSVTEKLSRLQPGGRKAPGQSTVGAGWKRITAIAATMKGSSWTRIRIVPPSDGRRRVAASWVKPMVSVAGDGRTDWLSVRKAVGEVVAGQAGEIAGSLLRADAGAPEARAFLPSEAVNQRLRKMMQGWIPQIFDYRSSGPAAVARQIEGQRCTRGSSCRWMSDRHRVMRHDPRAPGVDFRHARSTLAVHLYVADRPYMADLLMIGAHA